MGNEWKIVTLVLITAFCVGCQSSIDEFQFINMSERDIYVSEVNGFNHNPPVGYLSKGVFAHSLNMDSRLIGTCEIIWGYQNNQDGGIPDEFYTSPCGLEELGRKDSKGIKFTFNSDLRWTVSSLGQ
ncbi:hypothetical protein ACFODZ_03845 [Marinicella sediminis]|uniref:Uncharacterized protein n=1 Tax=Marinicella sediminis TaxID=1792834 RepID=A0ABV7J8F5_9GAMM|nr:hypothetical protein [Marinicella sediminis]